MKQTLIALDQLFNAMLGGMADETLSARSYRCWLTGRWSPVPRVLIDALFFWQPRHCQRSYDAEYARRQLPSHYRSRACS